MNALGAWPTWLSTATRPFALADRRRIERISAAAAGWSRASDCDLAEAAARLRARVRAGEAVNSPALFDVALALAAEAARRGTGHRPYATQLRAALALSRGSVAEMHTGEGKTLATALAAAALALGGEGVHVATVNSYLATRDAAEFRPWAELLGLRVGLLGERGTPDEKRAAYAADVTYGMGYEFGFDYLRDQLARAAAARPAGLGSQTLERLRGRSSPPPATVQRGHAWALVDEIDAVLIDEGRTPLVISGPSGRPAADAPAYLAARQAARALRVESDYVIDWTQRALWLTPAGQVRVAAAGEPVRALLVRPWTTYVTQALRAEHLLRRDVDYTLAEGRVRLVDPLTGRIFQDRSWSDGLQQAVEAREELTIRAEAETLARISRQRYFRLYRRLAGLTGTAMGAAGEFRRLFGLGVESIPLRCPSRRREAPPALFASAEAKWRAVVEEVAHVHGTGRPVLVGTPSIAASEDLAGRLRRRGVPHQVLNGRQDGDEAQIVAQAGQRGQVTVATNMAGRGTDIRLGPGVAELGGLHVIGTEPHRSRRIDRQLLGRAARQGDPGSGRFFVSAEDELVGSYGPELAAALTDQAAAAPVSGAAWARRLARLQRKVERHDAQQRRDLLAHDHWLDELLVDLGRPT